MGCDIHATIEYNKWKDRLPSYWIGMAKDFDIDRLYTLFGYLAGVRDDDVEPLSKPKGVPIDASYEFKEELESWDSDAHTTSWLTFEELQKLPDEYKTEMFFQTMKLAADRYGEKNVRLVFFFDN